MEFPADLKIIINSAMSIDGKISSYSGNSRISSKKDLVRVHKLRSKVDAIVVGINTVLIDNPMLTIRYIRNNRISPTRIIVDSYGRIPLDSKILRSATKIKTIIVVTKQASRDTIEEIKKSGAYVIIIGSKLVNLKRLFKMLYDMGYRKILIEGGGELNWSCLHDGIVNELIITITPKVLGGRDAVTLVEGRGYSTISQAIKLKLTKIIQNKNDNEITLYYTK
ncbi:MAG TPA: 2,5-diamino-6-(ribosylamino)-4(3H)-pyrimidinone 5'-phosphate reductase [Nitrososphaeraceae archaeon]|nr:2,5-diamino-6-(ribosylamino)-4(3H)-pyrimidinone 5'-phosphate reductase [Nitrososphaeraceae archaeon]